MPDHRDIYRREADQYEYLVACEDYQGNLLPAIRQGFPLEGKDVVELGAGTGRLTCLLAPLVCSMRAYDVSQAISDIEKEMVEAADALEFERAAVLRDQIRELESGAGLARKTERTELETSAISAKPRRREGMNSRSSRRLKVSYTIPARKRGREGSKKR